MIGNKAKILGVSINSTSSSSVLGEIVKLASIQAEKKAKSGSSLIFTPNPEFLVEADRDPEFRALLNKAEVNLPDGIGLIWAGKVLGEPILERVSGADVVEGLLETGNKEKWIVGIVGARRGDESELKVLFANLGRKYPNISFVGLDSNSKFEILNSKFNIVLACHGMKKQENWIWENKDKISSNVFMGIGGSLDFLTGFTYRAPVLLRSLGFEWVWRLIQKPSHIRRIWRAVFVFGWLVIKERFRI